MADRTIAILGGGTGGLVAARRLRRSIDPADRVVPVDRDATFAFAPSYLWVMGRRDTTTATRPPSKRDSACPAATAPSRVQRLWAASTKPGREAAVTVAAPHSGLTPARRPGRPCRGRTAPLP